jgi:endoglucanase
VLVRHILLAEFLVEEFVRCFEGLGPADAADLAGSFAFDRCVRRVELEELITRDTRPPA